MHRGRGLPAHTRDEGAQHCTFIAGAGTRAAGCAAGRELQLSRVWYCQYCKRLSAAVEAAASTQPGFKGGLTAGRRVHQDTGLGDGALGLGTPGDTGLWDH
jgi:hypothetical protein